MVQALHINGRSYDVGVFLQGTENVLLLIEDFEDVKAPGVLRQRTEVIAGCPGTLDECHTGCMVLSSHPLGSKGWYIFTPQPPRDGESMFVFVLADSQAAMCKCMHLHRC